MAQRQAQRGGAFVSGLDDLVKRGQSELDRLGSDLRRAQHDVQAGLRRAVQQYPLADAGQVLADAGKRLIGSPDALRRSDPPRSRPRSPTPSLPPFAKPAVDVATAAGQLFGTGRGAVDTAVGLGETAVLTTRLLNPVLDRAFSPLLGQPTAGRQVTDAVTEAGRYVSDFGGGRRTLGGEVARELRKANVRLNPAATPPAKTLGGEVRRNFEIGANQGELAADVAPFFVAGPGAIPVGRMATRVRPLTKADYRKHPEERAAWLAEPYTGRGHHSWAQAKMLKVEKKLDSLGLGLLSKALARYRESPFNVLKPEGMTNGQFLPLHVGVDPSYHGGNAPKHVDGGRWSAKDLHFAKYPWHLQTWRGIPGPLKARIGGGVVSMQVAADAMADRDDD